MLARRSFVSSSSFSATTKISFITRRMKFFGTTTRTGASTISTATSLALLSLAAQQQAHRGGGCLVAVASAFSPLGGLLRTTITSRSSSSSSSTTGALASNKMDQSFKTWSFDKPCTTMEWSEMVNAKLTFEDGSSSTSSLETATDADLVVIGVMAPAKDAETKDDDSGDDSDDSDDEKEKPAPTIVLSGLAKDIDDSLNGVLTQILEEQYKTFKNGATIGATTAPVRVVVPGSSSKAKRYVLLGLGTRPKAEPDEKAADGKEDNDETKKKTKDPWKAAGLALGKAVANSCNAKKVETANVLLPRSGLLLSKAILLQDFATSFYEALYSDNRYRTGAKKKTAAEDLKSVTIIAETTAAVADDDATAATAGAAVVMSSDQANAALDMGRKIATGVCLTKDIVNAPHNVLNSIALADTAKRIAAECKSGRIKCQVLGKAECEKRGMGAYLGVARGSETEPQFIHLTYKPLSGTIVKKIAVIGKGLLFDTGGYNIKTAGMEQMKFDCGGSAAVLGAARAIGMLEPEGVEAHFIVAACENMINQKAMVPSDILTASNGKTIEVGNTDAEGRLTLADALVFADKEVGAESIIELSTLTGACMVSLGKEISGIWTDNDDLAQELDDISKMTGDKSWRMPMAKEYNKQLESKIADIKNIGTRYGGAITAALFLQNFVSKKTPFAHIDIAGPVWDDKTCATGYGAKLVVEWIRRQGQEKSD